MKNTIRLGVIVSVLAVVAVLGFAIVQAQDATTSDLVSCDSDLILSLYVAERYLGYNDFRNQLSASGMDTTRLSHFSRFNYGQYRPLFDTFRSGAAMGDLSSTSGDAAATEEAAGTTGDTLGQTWNRPGGQWDPNWMAGVSSAYMLDDATFDQNRQSMFPEGTDSSTISPLNPSSIAGEPAECTQLRNELNRFYRALAFQDFSSINTGMGAQG